MAFVVLLVALIIWIAYKIYQAATPSNPPFEDTTEMMKTIMSLPDQKSRQRWLKQRAKQARRNGYTQPSSPNTDNDKKITVSQSSSYDQALETIKKNVALYSNKSPNTNSVIHQEQSSESTSIIVSDNPEALTPKQTIIQNPTEGIVIDGIKRGLTDLGFTSITATLIPGNQGVWVGCYYGNDEYIFSCKTKDVVLNDEQIGTPVINIFESIFVGNSDCDDVIVYYNNLFVKHGFSDLKIRIQTVGIICITAQHTGTEYFFKFVYPFTKTDFIIKLTTTQNGKVKIHWNKLEDVKYYEVIRVDKKQNKTILGKADTSAILFTDRSAELGHKYLYQVIAVLRSGKRVASNTPFITAGEIEKNNETFITNTNSTNNYYDIDNMDGHSFEVFCAKVLKKNGFTDVGVTQGCGDQGIDVLATKDGIRYGIQCKCYAADVGNKAVQEVFAGKTFSNVTLVLFSQISILQNPQRY